MQPRKAYEPSVKTLTHPVGESLTRQSFNAECNINNIMARFEKTGLAEHLNNHQGTYGDFTQVSDYHTALLHVVEAQTLFNSLPSKIRARFGNDPGTYLQFVTDPENLPELRKMGLAPPQLSGEEIEPNIGESSEKAGETSVQDDPALSNEKEGK